MSKNIGRVASILMSSIREYGEIVTKYREQFKTVLEKISTLIYSLTMNKMQKLLRDEEISFAAIDGTRYYDTIFDVVVFYAGAFAVTGKLFFKNNSFHVVYDEKIPSDEASSIIPIHVSRVPELDQTFFEVSGSEVTLKQLLGDDEIIDNTKIANALMEFSEYYLACKIANKGYKLILLDRTLSGDQASLISSTLIPFEDNENWEKVALIGYEVKVHGKKYKITKHDLYWGRYIIFNEKLLTPPPRADYLSYVILNVFRIKDEELSLADLKRLLRIPDSYSVLLKQVLKKLVKYGYLARCEEKYYLIPDFKRTWDKLKALVNSVAQKLFEEPVEEGFTPNKLKIIVKGKEKWLTTLDLKFLTLFTLYMLIEKAWSEDILVLGLVKDTAAKDFLNHFIPIMYNIGIIKADEKWVKAWENIRANFTDRMFLQIVSAEFPEVFRVPWSTIAYDTCFKTLRYDRERKGNYVKGVFRDKIAPERLFIKTYVQLGQLGKSPSIRSNVLALDRPIYDVEVEEQDNVIRLKHKISYCNEDIDENVDAIIHLKTPGFINKKILALLFLLANPSVPESFGYPEPLVRADSIAKYMYSQVSKIVEGIARNISIDPAFRKYLLYMVTYRERRERYERFRRKTQTTTV